jgi:response regulator RpfG family c-di-GMP phosphodiesterase/tRNA A-37 threonylcarbamoyl transferase component Bud32
MIRTRTESDKHRQANVRTTHDSRLFSVNPGRSTASLACSPSALPTVSARFLEQLLKLQLLDECSAQHFLLQAQDRLSEFVSPELLGEELIHASLLTSYQLDRVLAGTTHGLVMGNHRVLERLCAGGMGVVFLAEHLLMKRRAAIKVVPIDEDTHPSVLERFYAEMRVLAELRHPNIVLAFDAGVLAAAGPNMPPLLYLVMEYVQGGDLEQLLHQHGPVTVSQACEWIRQAACGLQEAHDRHVIHRDIKPSNMLLTELNEVKLVDFGLVRQFSSRLTDPRALLGTLEFMAPEQCSDASMVDGRADIYGLGASLFGLLTGEPPHPPARTVAEAMHLLQNARPRRLRSLRPDAPPELDVLIDRMLHPDPARRPLLPITVMGALLPFCASPDPQVLPWSEDGECMPAERTACEELRPSTPLFVPSPPGLVAPVTALRRVLLVDDERPIRQLSRAILEPLGCQCHEVEDGAGALEALGREIYDLLLLDLNLPDMDGYEICQCVRQRPELAFVKIIIVSGRGDHNQLAESLPLGADDFIPKPFGARQLELRVERCLRLKEAQDRAQGLAQLLLASNRRLESSLSARVRDVRQAQDALLFAMAKMAESREGETAGHLRRLQHYTLRLAEAVANERSWKGVINSTFLEQLERCVPLHDIGKIGLPESILLKPGKLTVEERSLMETHTLIGDSILEALAQEHGESLIFLGTASAIVRHHHERYDGGGYPDQLQGDAIPAAARLVAVADVYDALRRQRFHKPALGHDQACQIILHESPGYFDPALLRAFMACEGDLARTYLDIRT